MVKVGQICTINPDITDYYEIIRISNRSVDLRKISDEPYTIENVSIDQLRNIKDKSETSSNGNNKD